jgi:hypothetical protein
LGADQGYPLPDGFTPCAGQTAEHEAGHYDEAFNLAQDCTHALVSLEVPAAATAGAYLSLSWAALFVRKFPEALAASERSLALKPGLTAQTNRAHALMFLGRTADAKAIYLAHKGESLSQQGKTWEKVIDDDFSELRKAGLTHPLMDETEKAFGIPPAVAAQPATPPILGSPTSAKGPVPHK